MNASPLLQTEELRAYFRTPTGTAKAVDGVSFNVDAGSVYALVGESGCGKSVTGLSIMDLLPRPSGYVASGRILFAGTDLTGLSLDERRKMRGKRISMIFQEPMTSLNPVFTSGAQIEEAIRTHQPGSRARVRELAVDLLHRVRIPDPTRAHSSFPHQLSGGMRQRVMIAMALAGKPELLIADEPTTALDVTIQDQILTLINELKAELGMSVLLITHNLGIVREMADRVGVMYAGKIVEEASPAGIFHSPRHPYTVRLLESVPAKEKRARVLSTIPGTVPPATGYLSGCRFADRCPARLVHCPEREPAATVFEADHRAACHLYGGQDAAAVPDLKGEPPQLLRPVPDKRPLIATTGLKVHFPVLKGLLRRVAGHVRAVDGVDLAVPRGSCLALVGESGCGKTTAGKGLLRLLPNVEGKTMFGEIDLSALSGSQMRAQRSRMQMIFQDPYSSLNPRLTVREIVEEGLIAQGTETNAAHRRRRVRETLETVGLGTEAADKYPHEFSGGQRQRVGIARALIVRPSLIVCDEATSALDVSVQAQILNLLMELRRQFGLTYVFITHDLGVVEYFADAIAVMYLGRIVESGTVEDILADPAHPYTKALLAAVPRVWGDAKRPRILLPGDVPSPLDPPPGCHFHPRCPQVRPECRIAYPEATTLSPTHHAKCFLCRTGAGK